MKAFAKRACSNISVIKQAKCVTTSYILKQCHWGRRENPSVGVRLNLPELTWSISCSIVTDHYLFQHHKAMLFGYLQEVWAGR